MSLNSVRSNRYPMIKLRGRVSRPRTRQHVYGFTVYFTRLYTLYTIPVRSNPTGGSTGTEIRARLPASRANLRIHLALPLLLEERGEREARVAALELDAQLLLGHPLEVLDRAALLGLDLLKECT